MGDDEAVLHRRHPHDRPEELPGTWFTPAELHALLTARELLRQIQPGLLAEQTAPIAERIERLRRIAARVHKLTGSLRVGLEKLGFTVPATVDGLLTGGQPTKEQIEAAARAGYHLQLSGHTHAGQLFPFGLLTHLIYGGRDEQGTVLDTLWSLEDGRNIQLLTQLRDLLRQARHPPFTPGGFLQGPVRALLHQPLQFLDPLPRVRRFIELGRELGTVEHLGRMA